MALLINLLLIRLVCFKIVFDILLMLEKLAELVSVHGSQGHTILLLTILIMLLIDTLNLMGLTNLVSSSSLLEKLLKILDTLGIVIALRLGWLGGSNLPS